MSEHEHEWRLKCGQRYYYCYCGETDPSIEELRAKCGENPARIKTLEGALSKIIQVYPIDALGLTVDARMREIAREALSETEL